VLILNGKYDLYFQGQASQMPLYKYLGTDDKMVKLFESGHGTPPAETAAAADEWLREKLRPERSATPSLRVRQSDP
jgi:hypothetical protein